MDFILKMLILIEIELIYNICYFQVYHEVIQLYIYICIYIYIVFYYRLLQDIEYNWAYFILNSDQPRLPCSLAACGWWLHTATCWALAPDVCLGSPKGRLPAPTPPLSQALSLRPLCHPIRGVVLDSCTLEPGPLRV